MTNFIQQLAALGRPIGKAIADPINSGKDALVSALMEMTARGNPSAKPAAPTLGGANAAWSPTQLGGYAQPQMVPMDMLADDYSDAQSAVQKSMQHGEIRHPLQGLEHLTGVLAAKSAEGRARKELLGARDRRGRTMRALAAAKTPAEFLRIASMSGDEEMQAKAASIVASQLFAEGEDQGPPKQLTEYPNMAWVKDENGQYVAKPIEGLPQGPGGGKPLTEAQSKDQYYYLRAVELEPILEQYQDALTRLGPALMNEVPWVGNALVSEDFQMGRTAAGNLIAVILRKETGATVTEHEWDLYGKVLIPQYGDEPRTLALKAEARRVAIDGLKAGLPPETILKLSRETLAGGSNEAATPTDAPANTPSGEERWKQILYGPGQEQPAPSSEQPAAPALNQPTLRRRVNPWAYGSPW